MRRIESVGGKGRLNLMALKVMIHRDFGSQYFSLLCSHAFSSPYFLLPISHLLLHTLANQTTNKRETRREKLFFFLLILPRFLSRHHFHLDSPIFPFFPFFSLVPSHNTFISSEESRRYILYLLNKHSHTHTQ